MSGTLLSDLNFVISVNGDVHPQTNSALARRTRDEIARLRELNAVMLEALIKLSNEVLGSLPLMEPLARREMGNSNYNILIQRAQEARETIARATDHPSTNAQEEKKT